MGGQRDGVPVKFRLLADRTEWPVSASGKRAGGRKASFSRLLADWPSSAGKIYRGIMAAVFSLIPVPEAIRKR